MPPALPVADPVRHYRRSGGEQLLHHDEPMQRWSLMTAVAARPGHPKPTAIPEARREGRVETGQPGVGLRLERASAQFFVEECPDLIAQLFGLGGKFDVRQP